jgi:hypothetical protein
MIVHAIEFKTMEKVTLKELYRDTFRRSALISIPHLNDLFEVPGSEFTKWEVFYNIVRDALKEFEYYYPYTDVMKIWIEVDSKTRKAKITDNFKAYLDGKISEDQICLVPSSVAAISNSFYTISTYPLRAFKYQTGEFSDFWYSSNLYYVLGTYKRPFIEEYDPVSKEPVDRCAVYYMNKDKDSLYSMFRDEVYIQVCRFLLVQKKNMMLQNMPIELFQGIEEDSQNVKSELQSKYQNASSSAYWII